MKRIILEQVIRRNSQGKDLGYEVVQLENTVEPRVHTIITTNEVKKLIRHKYKVTIR